MAEKMTPIEIVMADAKKNPQGLNPQEALKLFSRVIQEPGTKVYHEGNSIMVLKDEGNGRGYFHWVNADRLADYAKNADAVFKKVQAEGKFKEIYSDFTNPKVLKVLELQSFPYDITQEQRDDDPELEFVVTVRL